MGRRRRKPVAASRPPKLPAAGLDVPNGPGIVLQLEEFAEKSASKSYRYRNIGQHALDLVYHRGKLTLVQYTAGSYMRMLCEVLARSGTDSTNLDRISGSGSPAFFTQNQVNAARELGKLQERMSRANWVIVRAFCGDGYSMIDSLRKASIPFHRDGVCARVAEALDELNEKATIVRSGIVERAFSV